MKIQPDEIEHIASLAKLELSKGDINKYESQLGSIIDYIDQIKELDLPPDAPQMAHAAGLFNVLRADEVAGCDDKTREWIIGSFPKREGDLLESPTVFDTNNKADF